MANGDKITVQMTVQRGGRITTVKSTRPLELGSNPSKTGDNMRAAVDETGKTLIALIERG